MIEGLLLDLLMVIFSVSQSFRCTHHLYTNLLICNPFGFQLVYPHLLYSPHLLFFPVCTTAMPSQKVQKNQLKAAKLGSALMETTDQNIWDRLVTQIQGKMHLCPKLLQLVEDGTLEITREVKHDDCFSSFGPPALIIFFNYFLGKNIHSIDQ